MSRRSSAGGKPAKSQRRKTTTLKHRNAPKAVRNRRVSIAGQGTVVARLTHERDEALLREAANSEILRLISRSPDDLELVFRTILENATRICNANFGTLFRFDGENFYPVAQFNTPTALLEALTRRGPFQPTKGSEFERMVRTKQGVHTVDDAAEPNPGNAAKLGGARTTVRVPMLKDDALVGSITIYRQEVRPFTDKQIELVQNFAAQAVIAIENSRLLNELRQSLEQQTATADVLRVISSSPGDLQPVFEAMLQNAVRICEAKFGVLHLYESGGFRIGATHNAPSAFAQAVARREPIFRPSPHHPLARVAATKCAVQVSDLTVDEAYKQRDPGAVRLVELAGARSLIALPMLKDDVLIGDIVIYRQEVRAFTDKQIELLTNFAAQAVIAIENTRLLNELRQSLEQQTATADVLRVISSSQGQLQPVFEAMLANAVRLCEAKFGVLYRYDGHLFHPEALVGAPQPLIEFHERRGAFETVPGTPLHRLWQTREVVHTADDAGSPSSSARFGGARSHLAVPMFKGDALVGSIIIYRQEVRPFTDKQVDLVKNFAAQAVIAIENARLLNELRQRTTDLGEALEQQTATADVLRIISSSPGELQPVFEAMLQNAVRICDARFGSLALLEGDGFRFVALHGAPPKYRDAHQREPFIRSSNRANLARVLKTKQVVQIADIAAEEPHTLVAKDAGARTLINVPMLKDDELVGIIAIYRQEVRPFSDKQIELVKNFAAQAVIAIENTRLLNELRQSLEQQTATADVLRIISSSPGELEPVFQAILQNAVQICKAKFGNLYLHEGNGFRVAAMYNAPPAYAEKRAGILHPSPNSTFGKVIRTKQPAQNADVTKLQAYVEGDPWVISAVSLGGFRGVLNVPMLHKDELIGVISILRQETGAFADKQVELLTNFAKQAVIAIENTRLLNELRERTDEVVKLNQQLEQRVADQVGEIERMGRLRRFLPPQVADLIVASGTEKQLESHRREITALFCDLRGFTGFSESSDPEDVMALLRDYHAAIGQIIVKYSGTLERFAGDGVMVIFNDPVPVENPALQAVLMALEMRDAIGALTETWHRWGHDIGFGIGIAHGFATLGTIGFEGRFDYAAIGTVSNVASRLCDEAKPGQILISPRVLTNVDKAVTVEPVGEFNLKGIRRPMTAYNVLAASLSKPN